MHKFSWLFDLDPTRLLDQPQDDEREGGLLRFFIGTRGIYHLGGHYPPPLPVCVKILVPQPFSIECDRPYTACNSCSRSYKSPSRYVFPSRDKVEGAIMNLGLRRDRHITAKHNISKVSNCQYQCQYQCQYLAENTYYTLLFTLCSSELDGNRQSSITDACEVPVRPYSRWNWRGRWPGSPYHVMRPGIFRLLIQRQENFYKILFKHQASKLTVVCDDNTFQR